MGNELFMRTLPFCEMCIIYSNNTAAYQRNAPSKICRHMSFLYIFWSVIQLLKSCLGLFLIVWKSDFSLDTSCIVFKPPEAFQLKSLSNTLPNLFKNVSCGYLAAQWDITDLTCTLSCKALLFAKYLIPLFLTMWLNKIWPRLIINCLFWATHL